MRRPSTNKTQNPTSIGPITTLYNEPEWLGHIIMEAAKSPHNTKCETTINLIY